LTQQGPSKESELLKEVKGTTPEALSAGVAKFEGNGNGSILEPVYSTRKLRCYNVTEIPERQTGPSGTNA